MTSPFPVARRVPTNGIHLEVHDAGDGPVVLLLHGFPELAWSWRHQIRPLVEAGFRVVVPNQRGFGGSDAPADSATYSVRNLVRDLTGLLDALDADQAIWAGHDWGSMPAWYAAVYEPDRVMGIASLCTPYFVPGRTDLVEALDKVRGPRHYMRAFQRPGAAEAVLGRDVEATFRALLRAPGLTLEQFRAAAPEVRELPIGVFVGDPQLFGEPIVSDEDLAVYVEAFRRSGFTGGLNWYRALHRDWEEALGHEFRHDKPALMISGGGDVFQPPEVTDGMESLLPRLERHVIPGAGHWLQEERPAEVNALLVPWAVRNFSRHPAAA